MLCRNKIRNEVDDKRESNSRENSTKILIIVNKSGASHATKKSVVIEKKRVKEAPNQTIDSSTPKEGLNPAAGKETEIGGEESSRKKRFSSLPD